MTDICFKRIYQKAEPTDGARVLVDRLWPRGKRREQLELTEWYKEAAPTTALRRQWHQQKISSDEFFRRYRQQLANSGDTLLPLMRHARKGRLTLLSAVRNPEDSYLALLIEALHHALEVEDRQADGCEPASPVCYRDKPE